MNGEGFIRIDVDGLESLRLDYAGKPYPGGRAAWLPLGAKEDRARWVAPAAARSELKFPRTEEIPFRSRQYDPDQNEGSVKKAIVRFADERQCAVRLNRETGLPDLLFGDLHPQRDRDNNLATARQFLEQRLLMLAGRDRPKPAEDEPPLPGPGIRLGLIQRMRWADDTDQLRFYQMSPEGIRIYGAHVVTTFDANGMLAIVSSALYPAVEELPPGPRVFPGYAERLKTWIAADQWERYRQIPERIRFKELAWDGVAPCIYPQRLRERTGTDARASVERLAEAWEYDEAAGQWRFDLDGWWDKVGATRAGRYAPAVAARFRDQYGFTWRVIFDVTEPDEPELIDLAPLERAFPAEYLLFPSAAAAQSYYSGLAAGELPADLVEDLHLAHELDFGAGDSFANADGVQCEDYVEPATAPNAAALRGQDQFRTPTVFYHLRQAQHSFSGFLADAGIQVVPPLAAGHPLNMIHVQFFDEAGQGEYKEGRIWLRRGFGNIKDPGVDAEVIVHEFSHAVADFLFYNLFHLNDPIPRTVMRGLDEAQAFYLSSAVFDDAQWSDYAYAAWKAARRLDGPDGLYDRARFRQDPTHDEVYGMGLWLARLFWQIRASALAHAGHRSMEQLLFKALGALAGVTLSDVAPTAHPTAQIKAILELFAGLVHAQCDPVDPLNPGDPAAQRNIVRQVFTSAGLTMP